MLYLTTDMTKSYSCSYNNVLCYGLKFYWTMSSFSRIIIQNLASNTKRRFLNIKIFHLIFLLSSPLRNICVTSAQDSTFRGRSLIIIKDQGYQGNISQNNQSDKSIKSRCLRKPGRRHGWGSADFLHFLAVF